jgi:hypothetical protein
MKKWARIILTLLVVVAILGYVYFIYPTTNPSKPATFSREWGPWDFQVTISQTNVSIGTAILVTDNLTYTGQSQTVVEEGNPMISVTLLNGSGGVAWKGSPPEHLEPNITVTKGLVDNEQVCIPTTTQNSCLLPVDLQPGNYVIQVEPILYSYPAGQPLGDQLEVSASVTIGR